jgi:O-acetyl-ADP-ribose deacetylase (regulator of RNase III)
VSPPLHRPPLPSQNPSVVDPPAETTAFGRSVLAVLSGDITRVAADAIVNAANSAFANGGGVDGALRAAAGPEVSGEMRRRYPAGTPTGNAVATGAYALPARWVIHAVGPVWGFGGQDKLDLLASAYRSVLDMADELGAKTISAPVISA